MKKILLLLLPLSMALTMASCSDDENELTGTVWVGNYHGKKVEGCALRFISDSQVYVIDWEYEYPGDEADSILCKYTYDDPNGTITSSYFTATFKVKNENTMTLTGYEDPDDSYTLRKIK